MISKRGFLHVLILVLFIFQISNVFATWQETLEEQFDIVDTFDDIEDWSGGTGYHHDIETMPKKVDGSASIWHYYTNDNTAVDDWIKNHGEEYTWRQTGKSLCINYNNFVGGIDGYGPSRLGTYFGDGVTGKSGYEKINFFYMIKFHEGFFNYVEDSDDEFEYIGVVKFFDICSGFSNSGLWGIQEENNLVCDGSNGINCGPAPSGGSCKKEYGLNFHIFNVAGGGLSYAKQIYFKDGPTIALDKDSCYSYERSEQTGGKDSDRFIDGENGRIDGFYKNNEWFGVEVVLDIGTVDTYNGRLDFYIYNSSGTEVGHIFRENILEKAHFDHYYNKIVLGGNRFGAGYHEDAGDSDENRWYADDFIIDNERIAPTYFALLNDEPICLNGQTKDCSTGLNGICESGNATCVNEKWSECEQNIFSSTEICGNDIDEDCDGADLGCECVHEAELEPCDGVISKDELKDYIVGFINGDVGIKKLIEAINIWKNE